MINIVCVKYGNKFGPEYVNKLLYMVQRHLTYDFKFICLTENNEGLDNKVEVIPLPKSIPLKRWWWKIYLFKKGVLPENDTNLFFDLDTIIVKNIDKLIDYKPGNFVGLRAVRRALRPGTNHLGSAVMRWTSYNYSDIWDKFEPRMQEIVENYNGDQTWIYECQNKTHIILPG